MQTDDVAVGKPNHKSDRQMRLESIKARLGSLSPSHRATLYGAVARLILEDIPWLLERVEADETLAVQ